MNLIDPSAGTEVVTVSRARVLALLFGGVAIVGALVFGVSSWMSFQSTGLPENEPDIVRVENVRTLRRNLVRAGEDRLQFVGCRAGDAVSSCRLCRSNRCRPDEDLTAYYLPAELFQVDAGRAPCAEMSSSPCAISLQTEGDVPLSLDAFELLFFLQSGTDDVPLPGVHRMNGFGRIE